MAILAVSLTQRTTGLDLAGTAADAAGDEWPNTGQEVVAVKNGSGAPITVTETFRQTPDGATVTSLSASVAAGATRVFGPFPPTYYNDANNRAKITYSLSTSVTVTPFKLGPT